MLREFPVIVDTEEGGVVRPLDVALAEGRGTPRPAGFVKRLQKFAELPSAGIEKIAAQIRGFDTPWIKCPPAEHHGVSATRFVMPIGEQAPVHRQGRSHIR